jgi:thioredoxin reductase (NADPH)
MMPAPRTSVDLLLVGAGPVGLFGAYYAGFRGLSCAVMDSLPALGGQVTALYPEKNLYDIAGFPAVRGRDLIDQLVRQAEPFSPAYLLGHQAEKLERHLVDGEERLLVTTASGLEVSCSAVVITGGIGTFTPRTLPCGTEYEGRGLRYFVPSLAELAGLDVVIVGGGDSAVDWALSLQSLARSVTLVHRRERFRAAAHSVAQLEKSSVQLVLNAEVAALTGEPSVQEAHVQVKGEQSVRTLPAQAVIAALGFHAQLGPLEQWDIALRDRAVLVDTRMETSFPNVFAAGDIATYDGKVKLIAVGFGEVATAVNNAAARLQPEVGLAPGHSSDAPPPTTSLELQS